MSSGLAHHPRTSFRIDDILPPKQDTVLGEVAGGLGAFQLPQQLLHGYHGAGNVPGSLASTLSLCVSPQAYQNLWFPTFGHNATSYPRWLCSGGRMDGNTSVVIPTPGKNPFSPRFEKKIRKKKFEKILIRPSVNSFISSFNSQFEVSMESVF
jgi:hypothetical protein